MGRAHGSSKQQQRPPPQHAVGTTTLPTPSSDHASGSSSGGYKASASAAVSKKSLFDDEVNCGGGDDMFFDAKKAKGPKADQQSRAKIEEQGEDVKLEVNKVFAEKFAAVEKLKDGMRLKSLEERYGSDSSSGTPSSSSDEGSVDEEVDNTLIKTLEMIKRKDPAVYDKNFKAFPDDSLAFGKPNSADGDNDDSTASKTKKSKGDSQSVTLKDYFRAKLLAAAEKGHADLDDIDRGAMIDADDAIAAAPASYHEEAAASKKAFLSALDDDTTAAAGDSWFVAKAKSAGQSQEEAEQAKAFVAGLQGKKLAKGDKQFLDFIVSSETALNPQERWLRQYVWGDGWKKASGTAGVGGSDDDDEEHVEQMEEFETKYNFRFEEPGATVVTAYGRKEGEGFEASLRRKDNSRSEKRKRREERQAKEKQQRKEELKTLRNLKKQEAQAKLEQLRAEAGKKKISKKILKSSALDEDFDEDEHDRMMQAMFDDDYYDEEEEEDALRALGLSKDDEGIDEAAAEEDLDAMLKLKGKQRPKDKSKASEAQQKFIEKELAEVDAADFEDVIGDLPTRFKYRDVPAISIKSKAQPLTPLQILTMDDEELNKLEPLKIIAAPYRAGKFKMWKKHDGKGRPIADGSSRSEKHKSSKKHAKIKGTLDEETQRRKHFYGIDAGVKKDSKVGKKHDATAYNSKDGKKGRAK